MRKSKFRAWDSENEIMIYSDNEKDDEDYYFETIDTVRCLRNDSNYNEIYRCNQEKWTDLKNIMQYTGFKDQYGKEIYEEDTLKVIYSDLKGECHSCKITIKDITDYEIMRFIDTSNCIEVIGNIYEKKLHKKSDLMRANLRHFK